MNLQDSLIHDHVSELGFSDPVRVKPSDSIADVIAKMRRDRVGCVVVESGGKLRGIFTERDVLKRVLSDDAPRDAAIETVMTPGPGTMCSDDTVAELIRTMHAGGFRHMPVVDEAERVIGVVSVKRVVRYLVDHFPAAVYNLPPDPAATAVNREGG